jgi:hypothetical protein
MSASIRAALALAAASAVLVAAGCGTSSSSSEGTTTEREETTETTETDENVITDDVVTDDVVTDDVVTDDVVTDDAVTDPGTTTDAAPNTPNRDYSSEDIRLIAGLGLTNRECLRRDPDAADGELAYVVCTTGRVRTVYVRFTGRAATVRDWNDDRRRSDADESRFDRGACDSNSRLAGTWSNDGEVQGRFYCGKLDSDGTSNIGWTYANDNVSGYAFAASGDIPLGALATWFERNAPNDAG